MHTLIVGRMYSFYWSDDTMYGTHFLGLMLQLSKPQRSAQKLSNLTPHIGYYFINLIIMTAELGPPACPAVALGPEIVLT